MKLAEVSSFIAAALPFGIPSDTKLSNIRSMVKQGFIEDQIVSNKLPAWKPFLYRIGKKRLEYVITETIDCFQYGKDDISDCIRGNGDIKCRAELDAVPEVTISLQCADISMFVTDVDPINYGLPPTHTLSTHICVSNMKSSPSTAELFPESSARAVLLAKTDLAVLNNADDGESSRIAPMPINSSVPTSSAQLVFTPPLGQFSLASYCFECNVESIPIKGTYNMKEYKPGAIKIVLNLQLNEGVANNFEHCDVDIPFYNRGDIVDIQGSPSAGSIGLLPSLKCLVWSIGSKFTGKQKDVSLSLIVYFASSGKQPSAVLRRTHIGADSGAAHVNAGVVRAISDKNRQYSGENRFCSGLTCFVQLHFNLKEYVLSTMNIDVQSSLIYPRQTAQTVAKRELVSNKYVIWNNSGQSIHT